MEVRPGLNRVPDHGLKFANLRILLRARGARRGAARRGGPPRRRPSGAAEGTAGVSARALAVGQDLQELLAGATAKMCERYVATDVASRGLDLPALACVVMLGMTRRRWAQDSWHNVHRVGRAGRRGRPRAGRADRSTRPTTRARGSRRRESRAPTPARAEQIGSVCRSSPRTSRAAPASERRGGRALAAAATSRSGGRTTTWRQLEKMLAACNTLAATSNLVSSLLCRPDCLPAQARPASPSAACVQLLFLRCKLRRQTATLCLLTAVSRDRVTRAARGSSAVVTATTGARVQQPHTPVQAWSRTAREKQHVRTAPGLGTLAHRKTTSLRPAAFPSSSHRINERQAAAAFAGNAGCAGRSGAATLAALDSRPAPRQDGHGGVSISLTAGDATTAAHRERKASKKLPDAARVNTRLLWARAPGALEPRLAERARGRRAAGSSTSPWTTPSL